MLPSLSALSLCLTCLPIATGLIVSPITPSFSYPYWYERILIRIQVLTEMLDCLPIYFRPVTPMLQRACAVHRIRHRLSSTLSREWTAVAMDCVPTRETTSYDDQLALTTLGRAQSVSSSASMG